MKKKIFILLAVISLSNSNCNRDQEEDDSEVVVSSPRQYPTDVILKVKGKVSCYKQPNKQCLILQDQYYGSWQAYPFEIDGFSYQAGEYTLQVRAEKKTTSSGADYLAYKWIKTIKYNSNIEDEKANCSLALAPDEVRCEAAFKRAFFNPKTEKCEVFIYGGCGGVVPFFTVEECRLYCENP